MTREVLAATEGARAAGATEILLADSHGNSQNLLLDMIPSGIELVRSWPRPLGMMEGVDESFDAVLFIGYHTSSSNAAGVFAHTITGAFTNVGINGVAVTEAAFNAAIAGHFGVPAVMISGDDAVIEEARSIVGELEGAVVKVKHRYSFNAARTLTPQDARALIRDKAGCRASSRARALRRRDARHAGLDSAPPSPRRASFLSSFGRANRLALRTLRRRGHDGRVEVHGVCRDGALRDRGIDCRR